MRPVYALTHPEGLVVRDWLDEGEALVFHEPTGHLHLVTPIAAAVIRTLLLGPRSVDALIATVDTAPDNAVLETVETLEGLGYLSRLES